MKLAFFGPADACARARAAHDYIMFEPTQRVGDLIRLVRQESIAGVWINGNGVREEVIPSLRRLAGLPTLPLILHGGLDRKGVLATELASWHNPKLTIEGLDDPDAVIGYLRWHPPICTCRALFERCRPRLVTLPPRLERALGWIVEQPTTEWGVEVLAARTTWTTQYVGRCLHAAGLGGARHFLDAVRSLYIWGYARDAGFTGADVNHKVGRQSPTTMRRLAAKFLDATTRQDVASLSEDEVLARVDRALLAITDARQ
jgi:hypothetical protein